MLERHTRRVLLGLACTIWADRAIAQPEPPMSSADPETAAVQRLGEIVGEEIKKEDLLQRPADLTPSADRADAYRRALARAHARAWDECLAAPVVDKLGRMMAGDSTKLASSIGATSTNPVAVGLAERSGLVDRLGVALQGSNFFAADATAITLNLNALALFGQREPESCSAHRYEANRDRSRLSGSVTFGAKVPTKEITGFSGIPDPDKLFDVLVWDVKLRVFGDRDPRTQVLPLTQRWLDTATLQVSPESDLAVVSRVLSAEGNAGLDLAEAKARGLDPAEAKARLDRSVQASFKFAGQHLVHDPGMNKYSGLLLFDAGLGRTDFTLNASYSVVNDVQIAPGSIVTLKQWKIAGALTGTVARDLLVKDRGTEIALSGDVLIPRDGADVPLNRRNVWKADLSLKFPVTETAHVPISVTYTNDPNNLAKAKYVRGQVGITYDFGALSQLTKSGQKPAEKGAGGMK